jgi:hypothetical protein
MKNNPILNAILAVLYICAVASVMSYAENHVKGEDTIFAPIAFISLFTLSAAVMAYLFVGQPLQLYLDDKKKEAVDLFVRTLAVFAGLTAIALIAFFSGVRL